MNRNLIIDYLVYILLKAIGPFIHVFPKRLIYFLGRLLGKILYYFDLKHKSLAYANLRVAFGDKLSPSHLSRIIKEFYSNFGQNLIEVFMIPLVNKKYISKYIIFEGLNYIEEGFKRGKGIIFLGAHEGSWELSNIICANLGFTFVLLVHNQRYPRLNKLLNFYRRQKGCKIIQRKSGLRQLIQVLRNNQAIGMTVDQGGRSGMLVKFFGKDASMSTGAIKLALKYDATLIPGFYVRLDGPQIKVIIGPPFELKRTANLKKDIHDNLQRVSDIFEEYITKYPQEYLWTYKIWKYTDERNILILNDNKTGHLRQSEAIAHLIGEYLKDKNMKPEIETIEIKFKNKFSRHALTFSSFLAGRYHCQGCLWCLRNFLDEGVYNFLIKSKPDIVISCGASIAPINFVFSRENLAKSIVVMRPSLLSTRRFNLVVMPRHDNPPKRNNVVITDGALNLIDEDYLKEQSEKLMRSAQFVAQSSQLYIGLLIGGDTKNFRLNKDTMSEVVKQVKSVSEKLNAHILVTTSRRTPREIEELIKMEFKDYPGCKVLIIANEDNPPFTVGGILGMSQIIVVTPESISMISEAVSSQRYIVVFDSSEVAKKHRGFLDNFASNKYIYLTKYDAIAHTIEGLWSSKPKVHVTQDNILCKRAISRIL